MSKNYASAAALSAAKKILILYEIEDFPSRAAVLIDDAIEVEIRRRLLELSSPQPTEECCHKHEIR